MSLSKSNIGEWNVKYHSKIVGIHAALLNNGKIILFSYPSKERHDGHNGGEEEELMGIGKLGEIKDVNFDDF